MIFNLEVFKRNALIDKNNINFIIWENDVENIFITK